MVRADMEQQLAAWWAERLVRLVRAGAAGFRLVGLELLSTVALRRIVETTRSQTPCSFWAWTPGLDWSRHAGLADVQLDGVFASTPWWDGRADWYIQEQASLRRIASVIGLVEAPFRLAPAEVDSRRHALRLAATTGDGLMMPAGFEQGLDTEVRAATEEVARLTQVVIGGEMRRLTEPSAPVTALARLDAAAHAARHGIVVLINNDPSQPRPIGINLDPLDPAAGALLGDPRTPNGEPLAEWLAPGEIRTAVLSGIGNVREARRQERRAVNAATARSPVVIDRLTPQVAGGPFAVKRIIGRAITVEADIFADGHDMLAAELLWRSADEKDWQRMPMVPLGNDRWRGALTPKRIGRHLFTIEAWRDEYATLCHALDVKHRAGIDVAVEIADAKTHLGRLGLDQVVAKLSDRDIGHDVVLLTSAETRRLIAEADERAFACRHEAIALDVERPQAECASWYELFPRSLGTFEDVIAASRASATWASTSYTSRRSTRSARTNRKGRNNA